MLSSVEHICEVTLVAGPEANPFAPPDLLLELPHGATRLSQLRQAKKMARQYPGDEHDLLFLANTDQGSPEYGAALAERLTSPDAWTGAFQKRAAHLKIMLIRALLPRTILDVNRVWSTEEQALAAGLTRGVPQFITHPEDLEQLFACFREYHEVVSTAYALICGHGGFAMQLHTYAPLSVNPVEGEYIVDTLRRAYDPTQKNNLPRRPEVQLITTPPGGDMLSHPGLCHDLETAYGELGLEVKRDEPFNLHPATMAHTYACQFPGQTLTLEISRAILAEEFNPFVEMAISADQAMSLAQPIAQAFLTYHLATFPN